MNFIDEVSILVSSGKGGDGTCSFRREKYVPHGGPDGGDGGRGGDVIITGQQNLNTLLHLHNGRHYQAEPGNNGEGRLRNGASGNHLEICVPFGTTITNSDNNTPIGEITPEHPELKLLEGGHGGKGNAFFKSSIKQAPTRITEGGPAKGLSLKLELKLLADVGIIGAPNVGKSSLISVISAAKPKIADYEFTTLKPNLGVVRTQSNDSFVVADIPGIIAGAHLGKGLGLKFLKHIERNKVFVHILDCTLFDDVDIFDQYITTRLEIEQYGPDLLKRPEIICLNKVDCLSLEEEQEFVAKIEERIQKKVLPISSSSGKNLKLLIEIMQKAIQQYDEEHYEK